MSAARPRRGSIRRNCSAIRWPGPQRNLHRHQPHRHKQSIIKPYQSIFISPSPLHSTPSPNIDFSFGIVENWLAVAGRFTANDRPTDSEYFNMQMSPALCKFNGGRLLLSFVSWPLSRMPGQDSQWDSFLLFYSVSFLFIFSSATHFRMQMRRP